MVNNQVTYPNLQNFFREWKRFRKFQVQDMKFLKVVKGFYGVLYKLHKILLLKFIRCSTSKNQNP